MTAPDPGMVEAAAAALAAHYGEDVDNEMEDARIAVTAALAAIGPLPQADTVDRPVGWALYAYRSVHGYVDVAERDPATGTWTFHLDGWTATDTDMAHSLAVGTGPVAPDAGLAHEIISYLAANATSDEVAMRLYRRWLHTRQSDPEERQPSPLEERLAAAAPGAADVLSQSVASTSPGSVDLARNLRDYLTSVIRTRDKPNPDEESQ